MTKTSFRVSSAAILLLSILVGGCREPQAGRIILANTWDTVLVLGTHQEADTTLLRPVKMLAFGDLLFVLEDLDQQVRAFNINSGQREWTFGRTGEGPGEMLQAYGMFVDSNGNLRVWDDRNRKLLTVDGNGSFLGEEYFRDLWGLSSMPMGMGDRMIWMQLSETRPAYISGFTASEPLDSVDFDWPIPEDLPYRPDLFTKTAGSPGVWVQAQEMGPYFAVGTTEGVTIHPYVERIPYAYAAWERVSEREPEADTARWGARDLTMTSANIFVLSGGRPPKRTHPDEGSRFIDVYGLDGSYQHSYHLPLDSHAISTADGQTFFVLNSPLLGYPQIFGLRPKIR